MIENPYYNREILVETLHYEGFNALCEQNQFRPVEHISVNSSSNSKKDAVPMPTQAIKDTSNKSSVPKPVQIIRGTSSEGSKKDEDPEPNQDLDFVSNANTKKRKYVSIKDKPTKRLRK